MEWRIYCGDGSTFSSDDGSALTAPFWDTQIILQATEKEGVLRLNSRPYYWYDNRLGQWSCGDYMGMLDYVLHCTTVKIGRSMRTPDFEALYRRACADPDFPKKSLRNHPIEGPPLFGERP